jgi:alpha-L-arabinofuranosidase
MYKGHQNGQTIRSLCNGEKLSVSASVKDNVLTATIVNLSGQEEVSVQLDPLGGSFRGAATVRILGNGDLKAHNTFENPHCLEPVEHILENFDGKLTLPCGAVAAITVACG